MSDERPLNVRCAEALGIYVELVPARGGMSAHWRGQQMTDSFAPIPPFGEDSPAGWACTGPLIEQQGYRITRTSLGPWVVYHPSKANVEGEHARLVTAIALCRVSEAERNKREASRA